MAKDFMAELFIEIGTEEIPSGYITPALSYLKKGMAEYFEKNRLEVGSCTVLGTPRRLVISITDIEPHQPDVTETFHGPNVKVAFDKEGQPTKAAIGFARGKGLEVSELVRETTPKGEVVVAHVEKKGQPTATLLTDFIPGWIANIPFPKKMRWGSNKEAFARPMHWIVALFDGKVLGFESCRISSGSESRGHRFLSPESFQVSGLTGYLEECEKRFLSVDPEKRQHSIQAQVQSLAEEVGGSIEDDAKLLKEVNYLVEYPVAIRGNFDAKYLELPKELLVMTMKYHQKYFPVWVDACRLLPHFITISNMPPTVDSEIQSGNERVLKARLEDARFFFEEDRKRKLEDYVDGLKDVVWQKDLGTSYEKMQRFTGIAKYLAEQVCPEEMELVKRAAMLCKADLVSQMVYEFPELQGIMGGYYASHSGEDPKVAVAIKEHYSPAFAGDPPPESTVGAVVALSDKLDTILGCIGVGLIPSGSEDPYGLRRHALGIIQIMLAGNWQVSLNDLIETGLRQLENKLKLPLDTVRENTFDLFSQRFKSHLSSKGYPYDAIEAVLSTGIDFPGDVVGKVAALSDLKKQAHFEPLAVAFRRVVNILNKAEKVDAKIGVQPDLLKDPAEKSLYEEYLRISGPTEAHIQKKEFSQALAKIVEIKEATDQFFDQVMVMAKEDELRLNRLQLLHSISRLFAPIADFSKIVVERKGEVTAGVKFGVTADAEVVKRDKDQ